MARPDGRQLRQGGGRSDDQEHSAEASHSLLADLMMVGDHRFKKLFLRAEMVIDQGQ